MSEYVIRLREVPINSPKHRAQKGADGLWHAYRAGQWTASYGLWMNAMRCAADGVVWDRSSVC